MKYQNSFVMAYKMLIVLPSFRNGGTNTCLRSILPVLKSFGYELDIFAITNLGPNKEYASQFARILGANGGATDKSFLHGVKHGIALFVKYCKKLLCKVGIDVSPLVFKSVAKRLEENNYDLIICYQEGITTHMCSYFQSTPIIAWVHCDYERYKLAAHVQSENKIYAKFQKVVCVSEYTRRQFLKYVNSCDKVLALHNITDDALIISRAKEVVDDELFQYDGVRIVSVGRIAKVKGFDQIPGISKQLKERGFVDFRWYIIGDGDIADVELLKSNIKKYEVDNVFLLGNKNNPYPYIANADLYVSTSLSEACPCVLVEAQVLHTPIVSSDFGSVYEFIEHGSNGLISTPEKLAEMIFGFFSNDDLRNHILANIKTYNFDNDSIIKRLKNEVLEIAD